jgi:hypothetical protein
MNIISKLTLGTLLFTATLTSCNNGAEKKDTADSTKATVDTVKPKVDSMAVVVDTVKKDSGKKIEIKPMEVKSAPHQ